MLMWMQERVGLGRASLRYVSFRLGWIGLEHEVDGAGLNIPCCYVHWSVAIGLHTNWVVQVSRFSERGSERARDGTFAIIDFRSIGFRAAVHSLAAPLSIPLMSAYCPLLTTLSIMNYSTVHLLRSGKSPI